MPTYDYECDACRHKFEHFQSITDAKLVKCPKCKKKKLRRLIGAGAAIVFKGTGFYQTDYRSDTYKNRAEADKSSSEAKPEGKSEGKSESKAEAKSEAKSDSGDKKESKGKGKKDS